VKDNTGRLKKNQRKIKELLKINLVFCGKREIRSRITKLFVSFEKLTHKNLSVRDPDSFASLSPAFDSASQATHSDTKITHALRELFLVIDVYPI
jgi:hypothetical protein